MSHTNQIPKASSIKTILWTIGVASAVIGLLIGWYTLKDKIRGEYVKPTQTAMTLYDLDRLDNRFESKELAAQRYQTLIGRLDDIKTEQAEQRALITRMLEHCDRQRMANRPIP